MSTVNSRPKQQLSGPRIFDDRFQVAVSQFNGGRAQYPKKWAFRYDLYVQKRVDLTHTQQLMFLSPILWVIAVTTIRAAIIFLYVQIFPTRLFRNVCYAALAANVAFGTTAVIADCFICQPIRYRWAPSVVHGSCGDQKSLDMYIAILNLLQDIIVVVLPIPILWRLQMARSKKMGLIGIFGVGIMYAFFFGTRPNLDGFKAWDVDTFLPAGHVPSQFTASR